MGSSAENGSSISMISGSVAKALATPTPLKLASGELGRISVKKTDPHPVLPSS